MSGDQFNRKPRARAVAIGSRVADARRRVAERVLIAAAVGAALIQSAWLVQTMLRAAHP